MILLSVWSIVVNKNIGVAGMQNKLVLIGGGGHCKSVLDAVYAMGTYSEIVITDYNNPPDSLILGCRVVGTDDKLSELFRRGFNHAFITVGSIKDTMIRRKAYEKAKKVGFTFPTVVDPTAVLASSARIGRGVFVGKNAVVNADAVIEDMAIINTGAIIEHECHVGEFSHVAVGAVVCGRAKIENDVFVGANATVIQEVKIGMNSIIGAGSIIINDVPEKSRIIGGVN